MVIAPGPCAGASFSVTLGALTVCSRPGSVDAATCTVVLMRCPPGETFTADACGCYCLSGY